MTSPLTDLLNSLLRARAGSAAPGWLDGARLARPGRLEPLHLAWATAPRVLGRGPLEPSDAERAALAGLAPGVGFDRWTLVDAGRALTLLELADQWPGDAFVEAAVACYEQGEAREQQSWLKALPLLPEPERFLACAYDACRTNITPVFEAIACENPFPAAHYSELHFNQLVLRSMFLGVALDRIVGRERRLNPTLTRMAEDFAAERRAAGRPVPGDLALALHTSS
ncbi:MAG: EboA domain-containing protein [Vicinamibacterales bacterium]